MRAKPVAFARALACLSIAGTLFFTWGCERSGADRAKRPTSVGMRMRRDCRFLVMPEECMEAVAVEQKPRKKLAPGWH